MIYTKQEWFTPAEIAVHNRLNDCWVSLHGKVLDLTPWLQEQFRVCKCIKSCCSCPSKNWYCGDNCVEYCPCFKRGFLYCDAKRLAKIVMAYAGKDISHWFEGNDWVTHFHPVTGLRTTYHQHTYGSQQPVVPSTRWRPMQAPWWLDERYVVGKATTKTRPIRITNTLTVAPLQRFFPLKTTGSTVTLEVCSEETIYQIMMRYLPYNSHLLSYSWRYARRAITPSKTLEGNGIPDERDLFNEVALPENIYIPNILLYYNDDLTEDFHKDDCFCHDLDCVTNKSQECGKKDKK